MKARGNRPETTHQGSSSQWAEPISREFVTVHRWDNREVISDAPALVILPDGRLLCSVELWSRDDTANRLYGHSRCLIFASDDAGTSWHELARLPFATGKFLARDARLWFIGSGTGWNGLWVTCSEDRGETWSGPTQVFDGKTYSASTGWVVDDGTLYWAMDDMNPARAERRVFAVAADLRAELRDPQTWRKSNAIEHPGVPQSLGRGPHHSGTWLEPNVVRVDDRLALIVRVRVSESNADGVVPNLGAVCDLDDTEGALRLTFSHYYPIPGAQNHFHIVPDEHNGLFWMTSNLVTGVARQLYRGWGKERRFLMLHYSVDAQNWFPAGVLAMWPKETQAFNYCTPVIDGDDLLFVSRTAEQAANQHDNDTITFHRVPDFRQLAVNLHPAH
ncbi:sialidase family protein [Verrucomicrobiota bacterium]